MRIAIDDFGTGYSSLAYLRQFPVDSLKIDRSFISAHRESTEAGALIHTLVQLGKTLGLETLAEGIEEHDQFAQLQREHCDSGQGFLLARPLDPEALERYLADQAHRGTRTDPSSGDHACVSPNIPTCSRCRSATRSTGTPGASPATRP